jgi:DNA-binding NarL/FixJ family response regulator
MSRIRIVLADDHTLVRAGIRSLLEKIPGTEVIGEADNGREAIDLIGALKPDVALLDIGIPEHNGLEVARRTADVSPHTRVVILSMHADAIYVRQALSAGVAGYLLKGAAVAELPLALESVMRGETYLTPKVSHYVVQGFLRESDPQAGLLDELTGRQREILQLIAEGHSMKEVAHKLNLSVKTVETHRTRMMDRLGIHDVAGLVRLAVRAGLVPPV